MNEQAREYARRLRALNVPRDAIEILCAGEPSEHLQEVLQAYDELGEQTDVLTARLSYVTPPTQQQLEGIREFLKKRYQCSDVNLQLAEDKSLIRGF
jgi:F0F1-type ATP synthase delta subunit